MKCEPPLQTLTADIHKSGSGPREEDVGNEMCAGAEIWTQSFYPDRMEISALDNVWRNETKQEEHISS